MIYTVRASISQDDLRDNGVDIECECHTLKEAKARAKYYLTEEFRKACESTKVRCYSQVLRGDGVIVADYFL